MFRLIIIYSLVLYNGLDPRVRAFLRRGLGLGILGMSSPEGLSLHILDPIEQAIDEYFQLLVSSHKANTTVPPPWV
jgi:hypothetical protein